jgi:hypothetical protein
MKQAVRKRGFGGVTGDINRRRGPDCALGAPAIRLRKTSRETLCPNVADVSGRNGFKPAFQAWSAAIKSGNATMLRKRLRL